MTDQITRRRGEGERAKKAEAGGDNPGEVRGEPDQPRAPQKGSPDPHADAERENEAEEEPQEADLDQPSD
jgi:hypothetical protein